MKLLNCTRCDDILKLVDLRERRCECGACIGAVDKQEAVTATGPVRVLEIPWTEYDQAMPGDWRRWRVQPLPARK